jgi:hypothetical protein
VCLCVLVTLYIIEENGTFPTPEKRDSQVASDVGFAAIRTQSGVSGDL